jgi:hypothetical protein
VQQQQQVQEQPSGYVRSRTHDPRTVAFFAEGESSSGCGEAKPPIRKSFSNPNLAKQLQAGAAAAAAAATKSCGYTSGSGATAVRPRSAAAALASRPSLDMPSGGFARARASLELFMPMRRSASTAGAPAAAAAAAGATQGVDAGDSAGNNSNNNRRDSAEASGSQDPGVMAECFKIVPGVPGDSDAAESITMIKYTALRQQVGVIICCWSSASCLNVAYLVCSMLQLL